jgi:hypothetical protein
MKRKKITLADIILMDRAARRNIDIELGLNKSTHRVHRSKKSYTRKSKYKYEHSI